MNQLAKRRKFFDTGNPKRVRENFQGYLFDGIDQSNSEKPISFFRSDFRGTVIHNSQFYSNDFSRADFIDSSIEKSSFTNCIFRSSEFYNCMFTEVTLKESTLRSASWNRLLFSKSSLTNCLLQDITLRECSFEDCVLSETKFKQNSFDEAKFENCELLNMDLSNMTAINMYFTGCRFENLTVDADYLGSYFFKGSYLDEVKLKYRGKIFKVDANKIELLGNLFRICIEGQRYYEALNLFIQKNLLQEQGTSTMPIVKIIVNELVKEENSLRRDYQFQKIFQVFEFYFNSCYVPIGDYFDVITFFDEFNISDFSLETQIMIISGIQRLKNLFQLAELSSDFIKTNSPGNHLMEVRLDESNDPYFAVAFENVLKLLVENGQVHNVYHVVGKRKGSVIYDIVINATVGLLLLKMLRAGLKQLRGISNEAIQIAIDFSLNKKLLTEAKKTKKLPGIDEVKRSQLLTEKIIEITKKDSVIKTEELLSICESIKYFPNGLSHTEK